MVSWKGYEVVEIKKDILMMVLKGIVTRTKKVKVESDGENRGGQVLVFIPEDMRDQGVVATED